MMRDHDTAIQPRPAGHKVGGHDHPCDPVWAHRQMLLTGGDTDPALEFLARR